MKENIKSDKPSAVVSLVKTPVSPSLKDKEQAFRDLLKRMGGLESFVSPGARVLIKPNAGTAAGPETGTVTDPGVIEALTGLLFEAGAGQVTIAESSAVGMDTMNSFRVTWLAEVARKTGAGLVDLKRGAVIEKKVPGGLVFESIRVFRQVTECDLLINVPTLKTIFSVPVSLGMKNLKGLLPDSEKRRFHHTDLNRGIADLNQAVRPHLNIIDGITGSELYSPKEANLLIAGTDIVALDTVGCLVMDVDPADVATLDLLPNRAWGQPT